MQDGSTIRLIGEEGESGPRVASIASSDSIATRDGAFDITQMPPERRKRLEKRLMSNPSIKGEYEQRIKEDPDLANNDDKRIAFFKEMMDKYPRK